MSHVLHHVNDQVRRVLRVSPRNATAFGEHLQETDDDRLPARESVSGSEKLPTPSMFPSALSARAVSRSGSTPVFATRISNVTSPPALCSEIARAYRSPWRQRARLRRPSVARIRFATMSFAASPHRPAGTMRIFSSVEQCIRDFR